MNEFLKFFDSIVYDFPMHLEIYYSKRLDWCITVYKQDCAKLYPQCKTINKNDVLIVNTQDIDIELCFAKAHVQIKEWLSKYNGGY